ncbi:MAG TPA: SDR family NAD(P)-dependent oxidoreductase [Actinoplanes sp.]|nr:SDR family NAD(P)-dependent oxidoreductase [Actinoplanes sp.]
MRTLVITGGTQGIGRALAGHHLSRGDRVVVVGTRPAAAGDGRLSFVSADLSSASTTMDLAERLRTEHPRIDALVLGAFRFQTRRRETAEGIEQTFALYVLSRFLLAEGLRPALDRAAHPVIVNLCGTGTTAGRLNWEDLQSRARYRPLAATMQGARANDLLGVAFTEQDRTSRIRYVLHNPRFVDTGLAQPFGQPVRALVTGFAKLFASPVGTAIQPIIERIDNPPDDALSAFVVRRPVAVSGPAFDPVAARRLTGVLAEMAVRQPPAGPTGPTGVPAP